MASWGWGGDQHTAYLAPHSQVVLPRRRRTGLVVRRPSIQVTDGNASGATPPRGRSGIGVKWTRIERTSLRVATTPQAASQEPDKHQVRPPDVAIRPPPHKTPVVGPVRHFPGCTRSGYSGGFGGSGHHHPRASHRCLPKSNANRVEWRNGHTTVGCLCQAYPRIPAARGPKSCPSWRHWLPGLPCSAPSSSHMAQLS